MPAIDQELVFAAAWGRRWPGTQVLPTEPASPAEPDSAAAAAAAHKPRPSTSAVTSKGPTLPAGPWAGCWQAVDRREARGVRARERLLPAAPQRGSTALAATTPPQWHLGPESPWPKGTAAPPALCPCGNARPRELQPRPLLAEGGTAKVTPPPPTLSHSFGPRGSGSIACTAGPGVLSHLGHQ